MVPPALQAFTKENDIQLLTHSDPCRKYCSIQTIDYLTFNFIFINFYL